MSTSSTDTFEQLDLIQSRLCECFCTLHHFQSNKAPCSAGQKITTVTRNLQLPAKPFILFEIFNNLSYNQDVI